MHIGVFILLLLSGERNFGVRLNKPYTATVPMDIPVFTGTHADLLITVFHKIIATGHQRLQPLFDCLLTILVNVSPYLKTLSMVASIKLLHLLEAFSTPWFLYSAPSNHHLVFFLLEIFNNIIQYQFDGNSNLVYTIIRKRQVFHALANLPTDAAGIARCMSNRKGGKLNNSSHGSRFSGREQLQNKEVLPSTSHAEDDSEEDITVRTGQIQIQDRISDEEESDSRSEIIEESMEGSHPALPAEPGTLKVTLLETPDIAQMTERESAHPSSADALAAATPSPVEPNAKSVVGGDGVKSGSSPKGSPSKEQPSPIKRAVAQVGPKSILISLR